MHTVRCPACFGDVGVEDADFGHAVACPLCGDVFTPTRPPAPPEPAPASAPPDLPADDVPPERPSRRRPRFEDDEDDDLDLERPSRGRERRRYSRRPVDLREAEDMVRGPATGLMVTAGIGFALSALALGLTVVILAAGWPGPGPGGGPGAPAGQVFGDVIQNVAQGLMGLLTSTVILVGAMRMKKLQSHTFAVVAAVVALLPCISPCCIVGLPIGIWALTTLNNPDVKDAFRALADREE